MSQNTALSPLSTLPVFELALDALLAFALSGVAWNVLAGYGLVASASVPVTIALTTPALFAAFAVETVRRGSTTRY